MFSPVSQISIPSSPFFSLSPPFISSFTPFHRFGVFNTTTSLQLNLGLSMDSTNFVLSRFSLFLHHLILNFFIFSLSFIYLARNSLTSLPSSVFIGLPSLNTLLFLSILLHFPSFFIHFRILSQLQLSDHTSIWYLL